MLKDARLVAIAAVLVVAACGKSEPEQAPVADAEHATAPAVPTTAPSALPLPRRPAIPPNREMAVYTVNSVVLVHPPGAPKAVIIKAIGAVRTSGWRNMRLVEVASASSRADIKSYKFVATSPPPGASTPAMQRVETELRVESLPAGVTTIRVSSESNEVSATIPP